MPSILPISWRLGLMAVCLAFGLGLQDVAAAAPLDNAATDAAPQRYVMTLVQAPAGEVAEEVLGQTLGLPVSVDPRVTGLMTFRVDGVFSPQELAQELGRQLMEMNVALVEDRAEGLVLMPVEALPEALARGAVLVTSLPQPVSVPQGAKTSDPIGAGAALQPGTDPQGQAPEMMALLALTLGLGWIGGMLTAVFLRSFQPGRRAGRPQGGTLPLMMGDPQVTGAVPNRGPVEAILPDACAPELAMPDRPGQAEADAGQWVAAPLETQGPSSERAAADSSDVIAVDFRSKAR